MLPLHPTEHLWTLSCRPLVESVSRMLEAVADIVMVTEPKGVVPSLTRSRAWVTESPAIIAPPLNGTVAAVPPDVSDRDRTPVATPVVTGLVLSVKVL